MYVDAIFDRKKDKIHIAERINGKRVFNTVDAEYVFYSEHSQGTYRSIYENSCKVHRFSDGNKFRREFARMKDSGLKNAPRLFEGDTNNIFNALVKHYKNVDAPTLNVGFFDIEVGFDLVRGFAPPADPFNPVTAISVYLTHMEKLITLVLRPETLNYSEAQAICDTFQDTILFDSEIELLGAFLDLIDDVDVLSGWNSKGFDIPYIVNRVTRIMNKADTKKLCLWDRFPQEIEYIKYKKPHKSYELVGRVHLDYLDLYQKHNPQKLHSYKLDFVGEIEVGENKIPYEGTLDDLYKNDFPKFIEYNRQDTLLLYKIDKKRKYIELSNQVAHGNGVLLKTTLGSVALVEQAIINEMHDLGFIVPQKTFVYEENIYEIKVDDDDDDEDDLEDETDGKSKLPVCGAYVAKPKTGIHKEIGCVDINSLYPSTIRALNMSPETIVGQIRGLETEAYLRKRIAELPNNKRAEAWEGIFHTFEYGHIMDKNSTPIIIDFENGTSKTMSGRDWYNYIFDPKNKVCLTANGTLFRTDKNGHIPMLLAKWYTERKELQANEKAWKEKKGLATTPEDKKECEYWEDFYHQRQQAKKILLNSLYGALLNRALRFYDERLGQSVTLTGRCIVRHMNAKINELITGVYDHVGDAIIYSDTDSSYFSAYDMLTNTPDFEMTRENVIALYDAIADSANSTFASFMKTTFNTSLERGEVIKAGRELAASKGLFIKKKKYALLCYEYDGKREDTDGKSGKLKIMGLDLKRSDTPKYMQVFLESLLLKTLVDVPQAEIFELIKEFRREFTKKPGWEKGTPKAVNGLTDYQNKIERTQNRKMGSLTEEDRQKLRIPGHVQASLNWNKMLDINDDKYSLRINDGAKIIVVKLKNNVTKMTSIAYPIDDKDHLPKWFKSLPFDDQLMEDVIIDKKLDNLFGVLKWNFEETKDKQGEEFFSFGKS